MIETKAHFSARDRRIGVVFRTVSQEQPKKGVEKPECIFLRVHDGSKAKAQDAGTWSARH
jgi:hypothetical protein